jgi:hypothetical protein
MANVTFSVFAALAASTVAILSAVNGVWAVAGVWAVLGVGFMLRAGERYWRR